MQFTFHSVSLEVAVYLGHFTQPSLSGAVARLELELGTTLPFGLSKKACPFWLPSGRPSWG